MSASCRRACDPAAPSRPKARMTIVTSTSMRLVTGWLFITLRSSVRPARDGGFGALIVQRERYVAALSVDGRKGDREDRSARQCVDTGHNVPGIVLTGAAGQRVTVGRECGRTSIGAIGQKILLFTIGDIHHRRFPGRTIAANDELAIAWDGYGSEDGNYGHGNHQFDQGEASIEASRLLRSDVGFTHGANL